MTDADFEQHRIRRALFGGAVDVYDAGRPGYPDRVYDVLVERAGLAESCRVLEIGPGTGQATGALLDRGARVTAIELGPDLAERLRARHGHRDLRVIEGAFEHADPGDGPFDLIVAATSFHWVPTAPGLVRCADLLRPGGHLALWWNVYGDPARPDPFHEALLPILERLAPGLILEPGAGNVVYTPGGVPFYGLDVAARTGEIDASGRFGPVHHDVIAWTGRHSPAELRALFGSFSPWLALPDGQRTELLDELERLAVEQFGGLVERPYLTPLYLTATVT